MASTTAAALAALLAVAAGGTPARSQERSPAGRRDPPPQSVYSDEISVDLLTLTLRVVDGSGEPLPGLTATDFVVRHRRLELPVIAVEWIAAEGAPQATDRRQGGGAEAAAPPAAEPTSAVPGRTVFWLQTDVHGVRIKGHLKFLPYLKRLLADLPAAEQVAVLSFDSHLKLWQDFTRNRELVEFALEDAVYFGKRGPPIAGLPGGLGRHLDPRDAKRAATPEDGLRLTAEALVDLPGEKNLVMVGWGLGRYGSSGFQMTGDYSETLAALEAARATVFVLDITDADFHTLELGLEQVARNTGGSYFKTYYFPSQAIHRLARTLTGHYRLTVDVSGRRELEARQLKIRLVGKKGRILAGTN